jgi:hypothetical protein
MQVLDLELKPLSTAGPKEMDECARDIDVVFRRRPCYIPHCTISEGMSSSNISHQGVSRHNRRAARGQDWLDMPLAWASRGTCTSPHTPHQVHGDTCVCDPRTASLSSLDANGQHCIPPPGYHVHHSRLLPGCEEASDFVIRHSPAKDNPAFRLTFIRLSSWVMTGRECCLTIIASHP